MASGAASPLHLLQSSSAIAAEGKLHDRDASNTMLPPSELVKLLKNNGVTNYKIYDVDHTVLSAFANSGISLVITLRNEHISSAANDQSFTDNWINTNVFPYYPATNITIIAVGNTEVTKQRPDLNSALIPAMRNLHTSLQKLNLAGSIKISGPFSYDVLSNWYPPSKASFKHDLISIVMKPLLGFLEETSSFFMIDINDLQFQSSSDEGITDPITDEYYPNLLDAVINAFYSAILAIGRKTESRQAPSRDHHRVVMTATGWPKLSDSRKREAVKTRAREVEFIESGAGHGVATTNEIGASKDNRASVLNDGLTPSTIDEEVEVYIDIFKLFNEDDVEVNFLGK